MTMTCVCGYVHTDGLDNNGNWNPFLEGDQRFKKITFKSDFKSDESLSFYCCPKCGTLRAETNDWY